MHSFLVLVAFVVMFAAPCAVATHVDIEKEDANFPEESSLERRRD